MATRETLHRLVDELPEREVPAAERLLEYLLGGDPVLHNFTTAPEDDESETPREAAEARERIARGEGKTHENLPASSAGDLADRLG